MLLGPRAFAEDRAHDSLQSVCILPVLWQRPVGEVSIAIVPHHLLSIAADSTAARGRLTREPITATSSLLVNPVILRRAKALERRTIPEKTMSIQFGILTWAFRSSAVTVSNGEAASLAILAAQGIKREVAMYQDGRKQRRHLEEGKAGRHDHRGIGIESLKLCDEAPGHQALLVERVRNMHDHAVAVVIPSCRTQG